jgi:hypothetical protein
MVHLHRVAELVQENVLDEDVTFNIHPVPGVAYSTPNRPAIPRDADHLIHAMPIR